MRRRDCSPTMASAMNRAAKRYNPRCPDRIELKPLKGMECLVGMGFRCWMNGYQKDDIRYWEDGWNHFAREIGPERARLAVTELASWTRSICAFAKREIAVCQVKQDGFCHDECIAVSMVAACQHNVCPALEACAQALLGAETIEPVLASSTRFARALEFTDVHLEDSLMAGRASIAANGSTFPVL